MAEAGTDDPAQRQAREEIQKAWGQVPNLGAVMALSLPMTQAVLGFDRALGKGALRGGVAEQLAIAVSQENRCSYCLAAHTAAAGAYRVSADDIADARSARASDPKTAAALTFAQAVVRTRGHVAADDLTAVRAAGWTDAEIVEIVGHAIATTLSNYLHHISEVAVDYPAVEFAESD
jgi:uncharacterized peroxidase-related enzyme